MKLRPVLLLLIALVFAPITLPGQSAWEPKGYDIIPAEFDQYEVADIFIVNDTLIWATAADWTTLGLFMPVPDTLKPLVMKSTDGGDNWEVFEVEAPGRLSWNIFAFDENTAWITTQSYQPTAFRKGLFLTTDGGATWTEKLNATAGAGWIHFFDEDNAVCYYVSLVQVTTNGGEDWEMVTDIPNANSIYYSEGTVHSIVGDTIWHGTDQGEVFRSTDRGHNWEALSTGVSDYIPSIAFANADTGLLVQNDAYLRRSTDGGATWNIWPAPAGIYELTRIEGSQTLVATSYEFDGEGENQTLYTDDMGESWVKVDSVIQAYVPAFSLDESGNWHGWIGAFRTDPSAPAFHKFNDMVVSVEDLLTKAQEIRLFPNPVVDQVTVEADDFSFDHLRIFDAQGRMLVEQPVRPTMNFTLNLSALPSGIFFLEIRAEGGTIIKKVVKG